MFKCSICQSEFEKEKEFHSHISKTEKLTLAEYYHKYHPRKDLLTKQLIRFKSRKSYLNSFFENRLNFLKWFVKNIESPKTSSHCYDFLKKRIEDKGIKRAPSQSYLATLNIPNINGFERISSLDEYLSFCKSQGLKQVFNYKKRKVLPSKEVNKIIIDTREKTPLHFENVDIEVRKLDYGDYATKDNSLSVERKSLNDFIGTMSSGFQRFQKEIERSKYLVVLVEHPLSDTISWSPPRYSKFQRATGAFACNRMRQLVEKYDNIQFLFVKDMKEAALACKKILSISEPRVEKIDLQWAYDNSFLT